MKKILIVFSFIILVFILYGFFLNPRDFKVVENKIVVDNLNESFNGFKILQISDLLIGSTKSVADLDKISSKVDDLKPDIIVFTGDIITDQYQLNSDELTKLKDFFKNIEPKLYKYAVMGDNDLKQIEVFQEIMKESDFFILDNESKYLFYQDNIPIKITGITNLDNINKALTIEDNLDTSLNLVITHYPDYADEISREKVDIILAGHSLKGQIRIPFWGGILKKENGNKYLNDYYEVNNTRLYISGGLGTEKIQFRTFNKPEINLYRLEAKKIQD